MEEIWKDVKGYEGLYKVSNMGRVYSVKKQIYLAQRVNRTGYYIVDLYNHGNHKTEQVHRLVAIAFIENPNCLPQVNHKDECKQNNNSDNLEWCDCKYNINYGHHNESVAETQGFKVEQYTIDGKYVATYRSIREAERLNNMGSGSLRYYFKNNSDKCHGYKWKIVSKGSACR